MSKRLTAARIEKWQAKRAKADALLDEIQRDATEYRIVSKGGRLSHLTEVVQATRRTRAHGGELDNALTNLYASETR